MSQIQSPSRISFQYIKTFSCKSSAEVSSLRTRNLIKNKFLPKFQIISQKFNMVTVSMVHYPKNGVQEIIKVFGSQNLFQSHILQIFNAYLLISTLFGKFELTEDKIKADEHGNVVLWPSNDYQRCFPLLSGKKQIQRGYYKRSLINFLEQMGQVLRKILENKCSQDHLLKVNFKFIQIKKSLLIQDLDIQSIQFNQHIQKYCSQLSTMKPNNVRIQKTFSIPEFHPFKENPYPIDSFKPKHFKKQYPTRFSYNKDDLQKKPIAKNYLGHFKNRFSNFEDLLKEKFQTNSTELKSKIRKQVRIPKFIKEKKLSKSDQIPSFKNKNSRTDKKINGLQFNRKIKTEKQIQIFNETTLDYLQNQQSFQVFETQNQKFNHNFSEQNFQSKDSIRELNNTVKQSNEFKSTRSSIKISSKNCADHRFFVPQLSLKEEKQIEQDLYELFSSRCKTLNNKDIEMDYEDEQLTKQFMCILN